MVDGWFPSINSNGDILSGSSGIWITPFGRDSSQISSVGTKPVWIGNIPVYNLNNGTTQVVPKIIPAAYNDYEGSDDTRWAGFMAGSGIIETYSLTTKLQTIPNAVCPRFGKGVFACITPYQSIKRQLLYNNFILAEGELLTFVLCDPDVCIWQVATGTYTRALGSNYPVITVRDDETPVAAFIQNNEKWVVTQTNITGGALFVRPFASYNGYVLNGIRMNATARMINNILIVASSDDHGKLIIDKINFTQKTQDLREVAKPVTVGPVSPAIYHSNQIFDLTSYIVTDRNLQPRKGPSHPQNQVADIDNIFHFVKFNNPDAVETYVFDENWMYHLEDASSGNGYSFTDPRWFPIKIKLGEENAFITGPHEAVYKARGTCKEINRVPFNRKMWVLAYWEKYDWGPDLGIRKTLALVYDNTAGIHEHGRFIEADYWAEGAGWCQFEAHYSDLVYKDSKTAKFSEQTLSARTQFYLVGGENTQPHLTGCVENKSPHLPLISPVTPVTPIIKPKGPFMLSKFDPTKVYPYISLKPSSSAGCFNVILTDGSVLSAHGDTRPSGADGPWEAGQVQGNEVTYHADDAYFTYLIVPVDKTP